MAEKDVYEEDLYSVWLKYCNQQEVLRKFLRDHFSAWCRKDPMSMLEVGCGFGTVARELFTLLDETSVRYTYLGIDPSSSQLYRWGDLGKNTICARVYRNFARLPMWG